MTYGIKRMGLLSEALRLTEKDLAQFGRTLIVAPHPDDESLACGGIIAMLTKLGVEVDFLFVSDGSMSHPFSKTFNAQQRAEVRKTEALQAVAEFNIDKKRARFMELPDGSVPNAEADGFEAAVQAISRYLLEIQPDTIFIPFHLDPHRDHQATWQILQRAVTVFKRSPRIFEYPVWLWELGRTEDYPDASSMTIWRLDIGDVMEIKRKAISAHQSQLGNVFLDDPSGFVLRPHLLAHFEHPFEIFFEPK